MEKQVRKQIALKLKDPSGGGKPEGGRNSKKESDAVESFDMLKWDQPVHLVGRPIKDPLLHLCEICSLPVLIYGRMKRCRHAFCHGCAKKSSGVCPKCKEGDQTFEEASMGNVYICTYGGGRYDNKGCGRSYLSQRDLDAHTLYRHNKDKTTTTHQQQQQVPNPMTFMPPFFQAVRSPDMLPKQNHSKPRTGLDSTAFTLKPNSSGGVRSGLLPPRPAGLPPVLTLPPGMVPPPMPGLPLGLSMVPRSQFMAKQHLPPNVAPPPPPPPSQWPPPPGSFKQT